MIQPDITMKLIHLLGATLLSLAISVVASCSGKTNTADNEEPAPAELPHIDWSASMENRTIDLNDYADFEYIPLETTDESVFAYALNYGINDSLIALCDFMSKRFIVFDRQGNFVRSIDRSGGGPGEYFNMMCSVIDLDNNELYVTSSRDKVLTYDLNGKYKHSMVPTDKLWLAGQTDNYDADHFITWDSEGLQIQPLEDNNKLYRYLLVEKKTGIQIPIPLKVAHPMNSDKTTLLGGNRVQALTLGLKPIVRSRDGFVISDFATDTLYEFVNGALTPIAVYDNLDRDRLVPDRVAVTFASGRYVGLEYVRINDVTDNDIDVDEETSGKYLFDRKTGEIFRYETVRPYLISDESGNENFHYHVTSGPANTFCFPVPTERLLDYLEKGQLRPEVEAIAKDMDIEANPLLVVVKFKE